MYILADTDIRFRATYRIGVFYDILAAFYLPYCKLMTGGYSVLQSD